MTSLQRALAKMFGFITPEIGTILVVKSGS